MKTHLWIWLGALILFVMFVIYGFIAKHHKHIHHDSTWNELFEKGGLSPKEIEKITHDEDTWYYDGKTTCVKYGVKSNSGTDSFLGIDLECDSSEGVCAGGLNNYGSKMDQVDLIVQAIKSGKDENGYIHEQCPILYS